MISIEKAKVVFHAGTPMEKVALAGLSLEIQEGEFVTVIGTNGAGKSTLLSALAGDLSLTSGSIRIDGQALDLNRSSQAVSRVFQDPLDGTCAELTVAENLALASARGRKRGFRLALTPSRRKDYRNLLKGLGLGLESQLETSMGLLSGGQRQAISLLMATLSPLKVLLLDEHTSALDPKTAESILQLSQKTVNERRLTAFMVTHSLSQALRVGTRTVLVKDGKVAADFSGEVRNKLTERDLLECFGS
jgi:putative ABC transport system ATP-binding protein